MPRTPDHISSKSSKDWNLDDEHILIANFCQALQNNSTALGYNQYNSDVAMQLERDVDLEQVLYQLNIQNVRLTQEYEHLSKEAENMDLQEAEEVTNADVIANGAGENNINGGEGTSKEDLRHNKHGSYAGSSEMNNDSNEDAAKLRQHTNRMETRISILVDHNKQLEVQLKRLRQLVQLPDEAMDPSGGSKFGTLRSKVVRATSLQYQGQEYTSGRIRSTCL